MPRTEILLVFFLCLSFINTASKELAEDESEPKKNLATGNEVILPRPTSSPAEGSVPKKASNAPAGGTSNVCLPNPCKNGGKCGANSKGEYLCACTLGFRGKFCQDVMMKCEQMGCEYVKDCLSSPKGAVCLCKVGGLTRFCEMDIHSPSAWEKVRLVISEKTIHTGEIIVGVVLGLLALFAILFGIHCHRVNVRRAIVRKRYTDILDKGIIPSEPPPDWCEISNDLLKKFFCYCCNRGKTVTDAYKPKKSLSTIKQKEEELIQLLNSHAAELDRLPSKHVQNYTQDYNQDDFSKHRSSSRQNQDNFSKHRSSSRQYISQDHRSSSRQNQDDFPKHRSSSRQYISQEPVEHVPLVNRQSYSQVAVNENLPQVRKHSSRYIGLNDYDIGRSHTHDNHVPSATQVEPPIENPRPASRLSVRSMVEEINHSGNNHARQEKSLHDQERKPHSKHSQHIYSVKGDSLTRLSQVGSQSKRESIHDHFNSFEDDFVLESTNDHRNNSARHGHYSDKSCKTRAKYVQYNHRKPEARNYRELKNKVYKVMASNFGSLKKSVSSRRTARSNKACTKSLQDTSSRILPKVQYNIENDITNPSDRHISDSSSEDNSILDQELLIMMDKEISKSGYKEQWHPHSSRNGNENAKSGSPDNRSFNHQRICHDKIPYLQQQTSSEDKMFYGHLIDPSMKHDNIETTHWFWDHKPGLIDSDNDLIKRKEFKTENEDLHAQINDFKSNLDFGNTSTSHISKQQSGVHLDAENCFKEEVDTDDERKDIIHEKDNQLKCKELHAYQNSINDSKNSQSGQDTNVEYLKNLETDKAVDHDISNERSYVRSLNEYGEKLFFVSDSHGCRMDFAQDTCQSVTMPGNVPKESEMLSLNSCSSPLCPSVEIEDGTASKNLPSTDVTPGTPIDTSNITVLSGSLQNCDTPVNCENDASETEIEL